MSSLPPNWSRYTTADGKEYFHNTVTNVTQWDAPQNPMDLFSSAPMSDATATDVFQYTPTAYDLTAAPVAASAVEMQSVGDMGGLTFGGLTSLGGGDGKLAADNELVSLGSAPVGNMNAGGAGGGGGGGGFGGFGGLGSMVGGVVAAGAMAAARGANNPSSADPEAAASGILASVLERAQLLFDVSTEDVVSRLKLVLVPYPPQSVNDDAAQKLRSHPDFYGPFWLSTTAVLFLAATGNFARLVAVGDHKGFKADYTLVSMAAFMIYGCLLAMPVIARLALFATGEEVESIDIKQMICIWGYSLAPVIPASILCIVPVEAVRWVVVLLALVVSLLFLRVHIWNDFMSLKTVWLKYLMLGMPCVMQFLILAVYRMHFFSTNSVKL